MEKKQEMIYDNLLSEKGNPLHETVIYKIGGTIFERLPSMKRSKKN